MVVVLFEKLLGFLEIHMTTQDNNACLPDYWMHSLSTYTGLCLLRNGISEGSPPLSKRIQACCRSTVYILHPSFRNTW